MDTHNTKLLSLVSADGAKMLAADDGKSPILVAPIGKGPVQSLRRYTGDGKGGFAVARLSGDCDAVRSGVRLEQDSSCAQSAA